MTRKKAIILSITIVLLCLTTLGITLGYLTKTMFGEEEVSIVTGTLRVDFEDSNFITLENATPMSDSKGQSLKPYAFTITNTGNIPAYYQIGFEEDSGNTLSQNYVKMRMTGDNGYDSDIMTRDNFQDILLNNQILAVDETITYQLWIWLDENADNSVQGTIYKSKVVVNAQSIPLEENRYCYDNGFTNLSDCMLVMEKESGSVEEAKEMIASKGTPDFSKISPEIQFQEVTTNMSNANGVISTNAHFTLGKGYTFDESTGMFTLTDYHNDPLTDEYIDYYTCGSTTGTTASCTTMYQIKAFTATTDSNGTIIYRVTEAVRHTYEEYETSVSSSGLYATQDDDGTSYYYRGVVKNNYVSFAGYIWRIIRRNGDGTIRMIYSGTSPSATGSATSIGTSAYNSKYWDPTYVGYKYHENFSLHETENATTYYTLSNNVNYYFGEDYAFDEASKTFHLTGEIIHGAWDEVNEEAISNYPYTCFSTSDTGTCNVVFQVTAYQNAYTATVKPISYSSVDYNSILQNTTDSSIKEKIDTWYEENLLSKTDENGVAWSSYLSDEMFCNDRSLYSGSGYLLSPTSYFYPHRRVVSLKAPSLSCSQLSDRFTVDSANGNGELDYPIGLITVDEVAMAGGVYNVVNPRYYLYTGQSYWTLSPSHFSSANAPARVWGVYSTGYLGYTWVSGTFGIRPVINLRANIQITSGDGSASYPFSVAINAS